MQASSAAAASQAGMERYESTVEELKGMCEAIKQEADENMAVAEKREAENGECSPFSQLVQ